MMFFCKFFGGIAHRSPNEEGLRRPFPNLPPRRFAPPENRSEPWVHPSALHLEIKLTFECTAWFYGLAPPLSVSPAQIFEERVPLGIDSPGISNELILQCSANNRTRRLSGRRTRRRNGWSVPVKPRTYTAARSIAVIYLSLTPATTDGRTVQPDGWGFSGLWIGRAIKHHDDDDDDSSRWLPAPGRPSG